MKKIMFVLVAALACVVTACSEDEAVVNNNENLITELNLAIEGSDSRLTGEYVPDEGFKFQWEDNEPVYVYPAEVGNSTPVEFVYDAEDQIFILGIGEEGLVAGKQYYAVCGATQTSGFNSDKICAKMNLMNHLIANLPMVSDIFTATADGTFATLHHMAGIVEIPVKGSGEIYDIKLDVYNSTDENLCNYFDVNFDAEGQVSTIDKTATSSCTTMNPTLNPTSSNMLTLSETEQSLFFPALPGTYDNVRIQYSVKDMGGGWSKDGLGTLIVERGKINKKSVAVTF